ncbi:uncharacterized protein J7T54_003612 [Emericellopsis cladophorae]|uniref:Uncharacterized protein n=1 Tax=Emericellopsis cladophorae TaxID=2686198 RepID=A0A9Q0BFE7_9HYPO|nr:uncharacterized protein J7T54_003612 [Emericellopsis cladophorae]KAI6782600.1 hypothetical protein J7T54_003612 [Emericellopsis cladophorae]
MASFAPLSGFQLPFQKRLSRLYNDTKKSTDFVQQPPRSEEDPEVKALHRKLRIQKDRLVSWGMDWSDPNQTAEIDESLSKAGLGEVVGSIMSTIKDTLAEAEPLWLSSKHLAQGTRPSADQKKPLVQWDKTRFQDLINDLTASIDTLYDLSRTRSMVTGQRRSSKSPFKAALSDEPRGYESTRVQTPQLVDPASLMPLPCRGPTAETSSRAVVYMSKSTYSKLSQESGSHEPWSALLLEYASFDPMYTVTGIMPPMSRFEKLSAGLQQDSLRAPGVWTGLPRLLGYFEDMEHSRFGLVYRFPKSFNAVSRNATTGETEWTLPTLEDMLSRPASEPRLEAKFRLAHNLANTVFDMHGRDIPHGRLEACNVSFCDATSTGAALADAEADVRRPLLSSFDVFTEEPTTTHRNLWRHPLDPQNDSSSALHKDTDRRVLELYSLGAMLLSIGLWRPLQDLADDLMADTVSDALLQRLAQKCGTLYMKAVHACWSAIDNEKSGSCTGEALLEAVQSRVSRFLETCCILDGVNGLEERPQDDLHDPAPAVKAPAEAEIPSAAAADTSTDGHRDVKVATVVSSTSEKGQAIGLPGPSMDDTVESEKSKVYPNIPLSPEVVDKWNNILMPQVNHALRQFCRKYPESLEISIFPVGPSPANTKPTVIVVCTSVGKVRAILKKRVGELFGESTGFGLKVCKGEMVRSRKWHEDIRRSMAGRSCGANAEADAINPEYQERPKNGASIGAWIGDRHLPPVSFGGLLSIDDKIYGMTVHHMLDDPDRDFGRVETARSSAHPGREWAFALQASADVNSAASAGLDGDDDVGFEISDTESEPYSESDIASDWDEEEEEEEEDEFEPGDIPGIEPGCGDGYVVTQPALDDVEEGFYPSPETEDEDHLDSYSLGEVYASSGIRRKTSGGLVHEVDWALFEFSSDRLPDDNCIVSKGTQSQLRPMTVASSASLARRDVQCTARTSGLQNGHILPAMTSVKIYGRASLSQTYQVSSMSVPDVDVSSSCAPIGIPGDSGAWIVDRSTGQLCGHVLAWSQRNRVAYICPMDVLINDIADTLEATDIRLPGGLPLVEPTSAASSSPATASPRTMSATQSQTSSTPTSVSGSSGLGGSSKGMSSASHGGGPSVNASFQNLSIGASRSQNPPSRFAALNRSFHDLGMGRGIGVGV